MVVGRYDYRLEEVVVRVAGLPRALEGYTDREVSDMHAGLFVGVRELSLGLSRVREVKPDLLVVTGDLVDFDARYGPSSAAPWPTPGRPRATGSSRSWATTTTTRGRTTWRRRSGAAGVDVLVNAGKRVRAGDGGGFALLGVDDLWAKRRGGPGPHLERAIGMVPPDAPRILLAHNPLFVDAAAGHVALQLSGHMHGGQMNPGVRLASLFTRYVAGRYERDGTTLWVNRGFGVAGPPVRLEAPPEVTEDRPRRGLKVPSFGSFPRGRYSSRGAMRARLILACSLAAWAGVLAHDARADDATPTPTPTATPAATPTASDVEQARGLDREGARAFREGRYNNAVRFFQDAYKLGAPDVELWNIARCYLKLDEPEEASRALTEYLARPDLSPQDRSQRRPSSRSSTSAARR